MPAYAELMTVGYVPRCSQSVSHYHTPSTEHMVHYTLGLIECTVESQDWYPCRDRDVVVELG